MAFRIDDLMISQHSDCMLACETAKMLKSSRSRLISCMVDGLVVEVLLLIFIWKSERLYSQNLKLSDLRDGCLTNCEYRCLSSLVIVSR